ncbi:MAG: M28 family peptidase [Bacteroidota bacterium]
MYRFLFAALTLLLAPPLALAQAPASITPDDLADRPSTLADDGAPPTPTLYDDPALVQRFQQSITERELEGLLHFFASDYFEGRETTARGQKMAAAFLAKEFMEMGALPAGTVEDGGPLAAYYQPFPLQARKLDRSVLTIYDADSSTTRMSSTFSREGMDGMSYLAFGGANGAPSGAGVVFVGHGITTDRYDDFAALSEQGIDVSGKWLLLLDAEPMNDEGTASLVSEDGAFTNYTTQWWSKLQTAYGAGVGQPAGFLIVADRNPRNPTPIASRAQGRLDAVGSLSLEGGGGGQSFNLPPIFSISSDVADAILGDRSIAEIQAQINETLTPKVFAVDGAIVGADVAYMTETVMTENVVAVVEGSDPVLKDEVVVLTAHYDHIGMTAGEGDTLNNGADDDGSGTMALVEMAEAFALAKEAGYGPRRTMVFLAVSGEEKGLLGSAYYADTEPLFPLESTVANLNIDMIGRTDPTYPGEQLDNYVYIIGGKLISEEIQTITEQANVLTGLGMDLNERFNSRDDPNQFYRRSDHWNFGKNNIPFIFYFNGTHEDYHQVGDEPQKIDYPQLTRRTQLIFATAWQLANQDDRVAVSGTGFN